MQKVLIVLNNLNATGPFSNYSSLGQHLHNVLVHKMHKNVQT